MYLVLQSQAGTSLLMKQGSIVIFIVDEVQKQTERVGVAQESTTHAALEPLHMFLIGMASTSKTVRISKMLRRVGRERFMVAGVHWGRCLRG